MVKFLVGHTNRMVDRLDIVPALPPLDDYAPTPYGRWFPYNQSTTNATIMVQVRRRIMKAAPMPCSALPAGTTVRYLIQGEQSGSESVRSGKRS